VLAVKILREMKSQFVNIVTIKRTAILDIMTLIKDHYQDKKLGGIKTSEGFNFVDNLSLYKDATRYTPTPYNKLKKMVEYLKPGPDDIFFDIGSGKGRVLFFVARQKVKKVVGIELHENLVKEACENLEKIRFRRAPVEILHGDAAQMDLGEGTIFFLYHPFGLKTFEKVIADIRNSLATNPRKIRIVYFNPVWSPLLDRSDWLSPEGEINKTGIYVWHNK